MNFKKILAQGGMLLVVMAPGMIPSAQASADKEQPLALQVGPVLVPRELSGQSYDVWAFCKDLALLSRIYDNQDELTEEGVPLSANIKNMLTAVGENLLYQDITSYVVDTFISPNDTERAMRHFCHFVNELKDTLTAKNGGVERKLKSLDLNKKQHDFMLKLMLKLETQQHYTLFVKKGANDLRTLCKKEGLQCE